MAGELVRDRDGGLVVADARSELERPSTNGVG
jgi:hypothetical protein